MVSDEMVRDSDFIPVSAASRGTETEWFAVYCRSRHEKRVAQQLSEKTICNFLPLISKIHYWSDRSKLVEEALFPGYLFVRIDPSPDSRLVVRKTHGVVDFVGAQGRGVSIPDTQIEGIQSILASDVPFSLFPFLEVGQRVRIRGGCLDGLEGILVGKNSDRSLVVSIDLIQRSLAVRVDGYDVEPIRWEPPQSRLQHARPV